MDNNRSSPRIRTIMGGFVVVGKDFAHVACQVKNMSATGALVVLDEATLLPPRFVLKIPKKNVTQLCEVRWKSGGSVGVEFVDEDHRPAAETGPDARIRELEAEIALLRRRVGELTDRLYGYGDSGQSTI